MREGRCNQALSEKPGNDRSKKDGTSEQNDGGHGIVLSEDGEVSVDGGFGKTVVTMPCRDRRLRRVVESELPDFVINYKIIGSGRFLAATSKIGVSSLWRVKMAILSCMPEKPLRSTYTHSEGI